jgi:hypothetical protein
MKEMKNECDILKVKLQKGEFSDKGHFRLIPRDQGDQMLF